MKIADGLLARPPVRLLLMQSGLALAAVLLIGISYYSLPARRPAPPGLSVAINADLFDH
jgi:hypothetical protein